MRLFIISLCVVMSLTICTNAVAKEPLPYKATTVDECIDEKECVWYYFSSLIEAVHSDDKIFKWEQPVQIRMQGNRPDKKIDEHVTKVLFGITPFVKPEISYGAKFNYLIIFSDDIVGDYERQYKKELKYLFGSNVEKKLTKMIHGNHKGCFSMLTSSEDVNGISTAFTFIDVNAPTTYYVQRCITAQIYQVLGVGMPAVNGARVLNAQELYKNKPSPLEMLMTKILYENNLSNGLTIEQAKPIFDKVYPSAIKSFKKIYKAN